MKYILIGIALFYIYWALNLIYEWTYIAPQWMDIL